MCVTAPEFCKAYPLPVVIFFFFFLKTPPPPKFPPLPHPAPLPTSRPVPPLVRRTPRHEHNTGNEDSILFHKCSFSFPVEKMRSQSYVPGFAFMIQLRPANRRFNQIGRAHARTPVTLSPPMPSSS